MKQSMFYRTLMLVSALSLILINISKAEEISLSEAETIALENDPLVKAYQSRTSALKAKAIAADTLPDPKLKLGLMNFPTDTYKRDQEPMTQVQVGIQQMIPRGSSLEIKSRRTNYMADAESAKASNQYRKVRQQVRDVWFEVLYWEQALRVVKQNRVLFKRLVNTTRTQYASGRHRQQDVVRAQLELGMVDDRLYKIRSMIDTSRAKLSRLLGEDISNKEISVDFPILPEIVDKLILSELIDRHPLLQMQQAMLSASEQGVAMARQNYKPSWMVDLTYGARDGNNPNGSPRADFASAMVMLDIPIFTGNRQDKYLAASQAERQSAILVREEKKRDLKQQLDDAYATWQRLDERLQHYRDYLVPKAKENATTSLQAYQSDRGDFTALMRAQITELETLLSALRIRVDYKKSQAKLLYLSGEK